jgi:hypothetical protein
MLTEQAENQGEKRAYLRGFKPPTFGSGVRVLEAKWVENLASGGVS